MHSEAHVPGDYELVAAAIHWLREQAPRQPSLDQAAQALGLAPSTLQRKFSAFAGVSPKRFVQYLTKEHALHLLQESHDVLATSIETGLSGPGRLHDLIVGCEALTPGEAGRRAAGVELRYACAATPLGRALAATTPRGLAYLGFVDPAPGQGEAAALRDLAERWPGARLVPDAAVGEVIAGAFGHWRPDRPLHLLLRGTNFQIKVWEALLRIPAAALVSYTRLAVAVGRPDAVRAVAGAVGRNPVSVLIPCHRVIRESGDLGGYHWGLARKSALIALESARQGSAPA